MLPKIETVLLATGLGGGASEVMRYAVSLARQYQAKLEIVYALDLVKPYAHFVAEIYIDEKKLDDFHQQAKTRIRQDVENKVAALMQKELDGMAGDYRPTFNLSMIEDLPDQAILRQIKAVSADVVVMGTHEQMAQKGALMGSCAFKVLHESTVPVLMVRIPAELSGFQRDQTKPAVYD